MNARDAAEAQYLHLIRDWLPGLAAARGWHLRFDHCFARIVLDHVFGRCWYEALDRRKPAYKQLSDDQLDRAIAIALRLPSELGTLDAQSLAWRGKRGQRLRGSSEHPIS